MEIKVKKEKINYKKYNFFIIYLYTFGANLSKNSLCS
jgi:hypothetical protein